MTADRGTPKIGSTFVRKYTQLMLVALLALGVSGMAGAARADEHRDFHGRDYHHLDHREVVIWHAGHWFHDWHDGRYGWWWIVDGGWYFYPEPVYPYPTYIPPAVVIQQAPPSPTGMPPAQFWYYCDNPQGYYPYVGSCNVQWRQVATTPAPAAPPQAPPPPGAPPASGN